MLKSRSPLLLAFAASVFFLQPSFAAQADEPNRQEAAIYVSGEGEASLTPDMAILSLSVNKMAKTAREALADNAQAMTAVIDALKKQGIEPRDLQTSGLSLNPQYQYPDGGILGGKPSEPVLVGYQVVNQLTVRLRDISAVGPTIDLAVELGINQGAGIRFLNQDPKPALEKARREAVVDARTKASVLADAAGVKLGRIVEINESSGQMADVSMMTRQSMKAEASPTPVEAGENRYQVNVNMRFAIEQ